MRVPAAGSVAWDLVLSVLPGGSFGPGGTMKVERGMCVRLGGYIPEPQMREGAGMKCS